jgi:CBS domain-containing protein
MRAADVMTTDVITVEPDTTVQALAALLAERGISGAPVVDSNDHLVGIISEGDLLHRAEIGTARRHRERRRSWWLDLLSRQAEGQLAQDYIKSHGRSVKDIMTRDVATVSEDSDLADVAALLETKGIKRVPVVRDGKIVGIISRANIVRAVGAAKGAPAPKGEEDDRTIREQLLAKLDGEEWAKVWPEDIIVRDGVVNLWVHSDEAQDRLRALRVAAEGIPGVRGVDLHIIIVPMYPHY